MEIGVLFVIGADDRFEAFLTGCVPNHGLYDCGSHWEYFGSKLNPKCGLVVLAKFIIEEAKQERALASVCMK